MSVEHSPTRQGARAAFTIAEFCEAYRLSRATLYKLWGAGIGPRVFKIGAKNLISIEAAAEWCAARETEASARRAASEAA